MHKALDALPITFQDGGVTLRQIEWGDLNVAIEQIPAGLDMTPLLKGLPDDRCNCPHWGYVLNGKVTYHYGDRDEVFETGDAFYVPAGHTPEVAAGTEFIQFSPSEALRVVSEKMLENARELQVI